MRGLARLVARVARLERSAPTGRGPEERQVAEALADLAAEPEVVKFSEKLRAALQANGIAFVSPEEQRQGYLWILNNCPQLVEQAAQIVERQAGLLPAPLVNGLRELLP
jgi:hypothetical protein